MSLSKTPSVNEGRGRIAAFALCIVSTLLANAAQAQGLKEQVVGAWSPASQYVEQDGKRLEPFGHDPKGIVIYQADGHFVLYLQKATLAPFASNNRLTGTAEENKAIVQGSIAYFGRYSIDEKSALERYPFCGRHELAIESYPRPVGGSPVTTTTSAGGG